MKYLSDTKVNTGRQLEIDLLKALCIIGMIFNHTYEDLGYYNSGPIEVLNEYLVVVVGASGFMVSMGISMHYSRNQSAGAYAMRGLTILTAGQLLNLFRNVLLNMIFYLVTGEQWFIAQTFLVLQADILSFAGLSFLLIALFRRLKVPAFAVFLAGLGINMSAWALYEAVPAGLGYFQQQMLGYLVITDAESFFPLTSYFVLVAFGYWMGELYPRIRDKDGLAKRLLLILVPVTGLFLWFRSSVNVPFLPEFQSDLQYSLLFGPDALSGCAVSLILLAAFHLLIKAAGGRLHPIFRHLSGNINQYYCISYVFILWAQTLLMAWKGSLWEGPLLPTVFGLAVIVLCSRIIRWKDNAALMKQKKPQTKQLMIIAILAWGLTVITALYSYPRIEVFANLWNGYLIP